MKRFIDRCRRLSLAGITFMLVGVVVLSTASRMPGLQATSGQWHTYKASRMAESEQHQSSVTKTAESAEEVVTETEASPPPFVPCEETLPIALPLTLQKHHFRSPPFPL